MQLSGKGREWRNCHGVHSAVYIVEGRFEVVSAERPANDTGFNNLDCRAMSAK